MRVLLPEAAEASPGGDALKRAPTTGADPVTEILKKYKTIAVVGLSANPMRPSYGVTEYMQEAGYRIIPVNPNEREVLGEKSWARLEDVPEKIEIVDIFRRPEEVAAVVESAIRVGAKVIWMQLGSRMKRRRKKRARRGWWWWKMHAFWWSIRGDCGRFQVEWKRDQRIKLLG
jgi:hypothetical protein